MEVLVISHGFQDHYAASFPNGLAKNGLQVTLTRSCHLDEANLDSRVKSIDLGQTTGNEKSKLEKLAKFIMYHSRLLLLCFRKRSCVVHIIGLLRYEVFMGIIEGLFIRLINRKYILTVHNILPHDNHSLYLKRLYYIIYRIPHLLMVHTPKMKSELIQTFGIDPHKITIIEHGINDIAFQDNTTRSDIRIDLGLNDTDFVLLFFGRISPYKGLDLLLDAFANINNPEIKLLIAGSPSSAEYGKAISDCINNNKNATKIVTKLGWIKDHDIPTYFKAADLLVMPYRHIDQSGVLFLSFRYGLPVLSTNVGSFKSYLIKNKTGDVVESFDPLALSKKIEDMFSSRNFYSRESIEDYAKQFQWETVLRPLILEYNSI
jgi:glycosyltransferase involved in cell wall biosynthesis